MGSQRVGHDWVTELNWTDYWNSPPYINYVSRESEPKCLPCLWLSHRVRVDKFQKWWFWDLERPTAVLSAEVSMGGGDSRNFANVILVMPLVHLTKPEDWGCYVGRKCCKTSQTTQTSQSTWISKMDTLAARKFKRNQEGIIFSKRTLATVEASSLCKGRLHSSVETYRPWLKNMYIHEAKDTVWKTTCQTLNGPLCSWKCPGEVQTDFPGLSFRWIG